MRFQPVVPSDDERTLLLRFLDRQRAEVVDTASDLDDAQARWAPPGHLLPILGIINHLTNVESRWIDGRYLREPFAPRSDEFHPIDSPSLHEVVGRYRARGRRTEEVVLAALDLRVECVGTEGDAPPAHVLLGLPRPIDLRWVLLHLIEETAHHAGHADATRELLDGRRTRA